MNYPTIRVADLKPHPENNYYFDDIVGEKWKDFLDFTSKRGIIEPIVISQNYVIVSGHQRVRACKELNIEYIEFKEVEYNDDDSIIVDLIQTNLKQRAEGNSNPMKYSRCLNKLKEVSGISQGRFKKGHNVLFKNKEDMCNKLGITEKEMTNYLRLLKLIPEIQDMVEDGEIPATVAFSVWAKMSSEDQKRLLFEIGKETMSQMTQKEAQKYLDKIKLLEFEKNNAERENQLLQSELQREKSKLPKVETRIEYKDRIVEKVVDKTDYSLVNKIKEYEVKISQMNNKIAILEEEDEINTKLINDRKQEVEEFKRYKERLLGMNSVKGGDYDEVKVLGDIDELYLKIHSLIVNELSPIKYSGCMRFINKSKYINESFNTLINSVQEWCDDMRNELNKNENIITVEVN